MFLLFQGFNSFGQLKSEIFKDLLKNTYQYSKPKIVNKVDTSLINAEILTFWIDKGIKSKINQINITGNFQSIAILNVSLSAP